MDIKNIELAISNNAKKYLSTDIEAKFIPSCDLNLGDFYSDYCILLAKEFKKNINEIYSIITKDLTLADCDISLVGDYINIKLKDFVLKNFDILKPQSYVNDVLIFIPVIETYTKSLFYRLVFQGFFHKLLLDKFKISSRLVVGDNENSWNCTDIDLKSYANKLEEIYNKNIGDKNVLEKIHDMNGKYNPDLFIIHLGPNSLYQKMLSKELFKTKLGQERFVLKFHSKDWGEVYREDEYELEDFIKDNDNQALMSLMYMLSTNKDFKEINYYDAIIETQENFIYFLQLTYQRLCKFFKDEHDNKRQTLKECFINSSSEVRSIAVRCYLLNSVLYNSLLKANIGDFLNYFDELLREINHLLNSPSFRIQLLNNENSYESNFVFKYAKVVFHDFLN